MDAKRDWGHARDYVEAMWLMLQQETPEDLVIATGVTTSVRDFIKHSFSKAGITLRFNGSGVGEVGIIDRIDNPQGHEEANPSVKPGDIVVQVDPAYFRPTEVELLIGDASKARKKLSWEPKYDLEGLVDDMIKADLALFKKEQTLKENGYRILKQAE